MRKCCHLRVMHHSFVCGLGLVGLGWYQVDMNISHHNNRFTSPATTATHTLYEQTYWIIWSNLDENMLLARKTHVFWSSASSLSSLLSKRGREIENCIGMYISHLQLIFAAIYVGSHCRFAKFVCVCIRMYVSISVCDLCLLCPGPFFLNLFSFDAHIRLPPLSLSLRFVYSGLSEGQTYV